MQRLLDGVQVWSDAFEQHAPVLGQLHAARAPYEQLQLDPLLESADLVAQRTDGEMQRLGRARDIAAARRRDKALQCMQRRTAHGGQY